MDLASIDVGDHLYVSVVVSVNQALALTPRLCLSMECRTDALLVKGLTFSSTLDLDAQVSSEGKRTGRNLDLHDSLSLVVTWTLDVEGRKERIPPVRSRGSCYQFAGVSDGLPTCGACRVDRLKSIGAIRRREFVTRDP